jgi:hypothetical protein
MNGMSEDLSRGHTSHGLLDRAGGQVYVRGDGQSQPNAEGVAVYLYSFTATDFVTHKRARLLLLPHSIF